MQLLYLGEYAQEYFSVDYYSTLYPFSLLNTIYFS